MMLQLQSNNGGLDVLLAVEHNVRCQSLFITLGSSGACNGVSLAGVRRCMCGTPCEEAVIRPQMKLM